MRGGGDVSGFGAFLGEGSEGVGGIDLAGGGGEGDAAGGEGAVGVVDEGVGGAGDGDEFGVAGGVVEEPGEVEVGALGEFVLADEVGEEGEVGVDGVGGGDEGEFGGEEFGVGLGFWGGALFIEGDVAGLELETWATDGVGGGVGGGCVLSVAPCRGAGKPSGEAGRRGLSIRGDAAAGGPLTEELDALGHNDGGARKRCQEPLHEIAQPAHAIPTLLVAEHNHQRRQGDQHRYPQRRQHPDQ